MKCFFEIGSSKYAFDSTQAFDISIPLDFKENQVNFFEVPKASSRIIHSGGCVVKEYTLIPHCHGTHTECVGHIVHDAPPMPEVLKETLIPATLITVSPENFQITKKMLSFSKTQSFLKGLIIRTLPNDDSKLRKKYSEGVPFISLEAMKEVVALGVEHLLVDFPSLDPTHDEGKLLAHRLFWNLPETGHRLTDNAQTFKTVTELIYVPNSVLDGPYLLQLNIPNFQTDAVPSRPRVYPIKQI